MSQPISTTNKIDVAGLRISAITKLVLLEKIRDRISKREKTFVVTPYSEFLYASQRDLELRHLLNSADFALADGVGILWADLFLSQPLTMKWFYLNAIQAWWQVVWTGASIVLHPSALYKNIPEKIVGADLIWDLARLAVENNFRIYLLGGWGSVAQQTAQKLQNKFPGLKIVGTSNKNMSDPTILDDINKVSPDMVFVAFKAQVAEQWIADNLSKTNAIFAIALGGTFDYIAGVKKQPPKFIRKGGLEWLWRLITQPSRVFRIYRAFCGLILSLVRYKVYLSTPYRRNACAVVVNNEGKILLCKRTTIIRRGFSPRDTTVDYWQFPQGGLDTGEDLVKGAQRELQEETGIVHVSLLGKAKYVNRYYWKNAIRPLLTRSRYHYKGQEQGTIFFKFIGLESEIQLDDRELTSYQWLTSSEVIQIIAPERREHAETVLAELAEIQIN